MAINGGYESRADRKAFHESTTFKSKNGDLARGASQDNRDIAANVFGIRVGAADDVMASVPVSGAVF